MKYLKITTKAIGIILAIPLFYLLIGLLLSCIPMNTKQAANPEKEIYLSTNGVHLDVVIPKAYLSPTLLKDLKFQENEQYFAFGWGDENFYLNTPTWSDLTLKNAASALLWNSPSLIHVSRYQIRQKDWVKVPVSETQLEKMNAILSQRFSHDADGNKVLLPEPGYFNYDNFYAANGSYHAFRTCNSWVNDLFKHSGLKTSIWTPYDFGVMWWY